MATQLSERREFVYISYGAGVQSTALLICSNLGLHGVPRADVAIFADTQDEPAWVYKTLERARAWSQIPIEVVTAGCLSRDAIETIAGTRPRFSSIPLFVAGKNGAGLGRRECTGGYKIDPIVKRVRALMGYEPGQRVKVRAVAMLGISVDEAVRMKPNRRPWITNTWPLIDARLNRTECQKIVEEHLGFTPKRSSCVYCPFHSDAYWRMLRDEHPDEFARACKADEAMRGTGAGKWRSLSFVHRSLVPLRDAKFRGDEPGLFDSFTAECEGVCGV